MLTRVRSGRCPPMRSCCQPTTRPICGSFGRVRCAAEDVVTALDEGAAATELRDLCDERSAARVADGGAEPAPSRRICAAVL